MSIILNRSIVIFDDFQYLDTKFYKRMNKLLKREHCKINEVSISESDSEDIYSKEELKFIHKNKDEFK